MALVWHDNEVSISDDTAIDIVPVPAAGKVQLIGIAAIAIYNPNSGNVTATIQKKDGSTITRIEKITIGSGSTGTNACRIACSTATKKIQIKLSTTPGSAVEASVIYGTQG